MMSSNGHPGLLFAADFLVKTAGVWLTFIGLVVAGSGRHREFHRNISILACKPVDAHARHRGMGARNAYDRTGLAAGSAE